MTRNRSGVASMESARTSRQQTTARDQLASARRDRTEVITDRRAAIHQAIAQAAGADTVLIAGKGHERWQEIAGVRWPFDDAEVARAALAARGGLA